MDLKIALLSVLLCCSNSVWSASLQVLTEHLPPMQLVDKGEVVGGMGTEIVQAMLDNLDIKVQIIPYNWARAYKIAQQEENVLIYSITRTQERENKFKWVGHIYTPNTYLWRLKSRDDIQVKQLSDAKNYITGVIRQDVQHQKLMAMGFRENQHLQLAPDFAQALNMLFRQRVDLFVASGTFMPGYLETSRHQLSDLQPILRLQNSTDRLYIAFSPKTNDDMVERFRGALREITATGEVKRIVEKWESKLGPPCC